MEDGSLWLSGRLTTDIQSWPKEPEKLVDANVTAMVAGYRHFLFLKKDGSIWGMGDNGSGQLGDGTNTDRLSPIRIIETGVTMVSAGRFHSLFLKSDGSVWGMGHNSYGSLGVGDNENKSSPVKLDIDGVVAVKAGGRHSCFLKSDGTLWTAGRNSSGQLGDGTTVDRNLPLQVATGVTTVSFGCDSHHTLFRKTDGSLWAVGHNSRGQLGTAPLGNTVSTPREVTSGVADQGSTGTTSFGTFSFAPADGNGSTHNHFFTSTRTAR